jgi:hypothetical protein
MADQMQTEDFRPATYDWSPRGVMELMSSIGVGSPGVSDWARYVAYIALPMRLFNDPETGEDIGFRAVAGTRLREAGLKIRGTYDR